MANPSLSSSSRLGSGVRPPSIMFASVGVFGKVSLTFCSSSTLSGDSMNRTSAPASSYAFPRRNDWNVHCIGDIARALDHFTHREEADVRLAQDAGRCAVAGHVHGFEAGLRNDFRAEHVVGAGRDEQFPGLQQLLQTGCLSHI